MQNTKSLSELLVLAFVIFSAEKHAKVNVVFAAEDGNVFIDENRAKLHVKANEGLQYFPITRVEAEATKTDVDSGNEIDENVVAEKTKELQDLELVVANYQKMKQLVSFFQIETADQKAQTLIDALTEYKSKISA